MKINGFKILGIEAPNMGIVILYPNVFRVIEREPNTSMSRT